MIFRDLRIYPVRKNCLLPLDWKGVWAEKGEISECGLIAALYSQKICSISKEVSNMISDIFDHRASCFAFVTNGDCTV